MSLLSLVSLPILFVAMAFAGLVLEYGKRPARPEEAPAPLVLP